MQQGELKRVLARKEVLALAFGAMVGWSWVALAGQWVGTAGALGTVTAFVLGGLLMVLIALVYAELAAAMPYVGGEHVYSLRALGTGGSFVCTWAIVFAYVSVAAFEAVALPTVLEYLFPQLKVGYLWTVGGYPVYATWVGVGMSAAVVMTAINVMGVKLAARVQTLVTLFLLLVGALFVTGALYEGRVTNLSPLYRDGFAGVAGVLVMVPFMFVGFDIIPQAAQEIKLPARQIGKVMLVSVVMAACWYGLIVLGVGLSLPEEARAQAKLATADASGTVWGNPWAAQLVILAGVAGIITSWNAFLMGGARAIFAMARAGQLPSFLGRLHPEYNTPSNAVLLIGLLSLLAPLFGHKTLVWLVDAGSLGVVVAYALVALSFLRLRRREPTMERPFRVAGGRAIGSLALVASLGFMTLYFPGSPAGLVWPYEWAVVSGWVLLGAAFYLWAWLSRP